MNHLICRRLQDMDEQRLTRNLQSVGMGCFVKYFRHFSDAATSGRRGDVLFQMLMSEGFTEKSCRSRISHACGIIRAGRAKDALLMIAGSRKVPADIANQARGLAGEL